eukprot:gene7533-biopygen16561
MSVQTNHFAEHAVPFGGACGAALLYLTQFHSPVAALQRGRVVGPPDPPQLGWPARPAQPGWHPNGNPWVHGAVNGCVTGMLRGLVVPAAPHFYLIYSVFGHRCGIRSETYHNDIIKFWSEKSKRSRCRRRRPRENRESAAPQAPPWRGRGAPQAPLQGGKGGIAVLQAPSLAKPGLE